jgi:hypothetical protein
VRDSASAAYTANHDRPPTPRGWRHR